MKFDVDFKQRLKQSQQAKRRNLGLPESKPKYQKYYRFVHKTPILPIGAPGFIYSQSFFDIPDIEKCRMTEKEYLLSCIKNEGWQLLKKS